MKKFLFLLSLVLLLVTGIALAIPPIPTTVTVTINCYLNNLPTFAQVGHTVMKLDSDYYYYSPDKNTKTILSTDNTGKVILKLSRYKNYFIRAELHAMVNGIPTSYYSLPVNIYNLSASQTIRLDLK